jgi:hypothetical protein
MIIFMVKKLREGSLSAQMRSI